MSNKHFIELANYIRDTEGYCEPFTEKQLQHLADFCHSQNSNFNRDRWISYIAGECGPTWNPSHTSKSLLPRFTEP